MPNLFFTRTDSRPHSLLLASDEGVFLRFNLAWTSLSSGSTEGIDFFLSFSTLLRPEVPTLANSVTTEACLCLKSGSLLTVLIFLDDISGDANHPGGGSGGGGGGGGEDATSVSGDIGGLSLEANWICGNPTCTHLERDWICGTLSCTSATSSGLPFPWSSVLSGPPFSWPYFLPNTLRGAKE